jgi:hypothetical protein
MLESDLQSVNNYRNLNDTYWANIKWIRNRRFRRPAHTVPKTRKVPRQTSEKKSAKNTEYAMYLIRETILRVFNLDGSLYWFYSVVLAET